MGTHVVMGRGFTPQDTLTAPPVAVVNQEFVKQFFGGRQPDRPSVRFPRSGQRRPRIEIVGVVEDTTYTERLLEEPRHVLCAADAAADEQTEEPIEKDLSLYAGAIVIADGSADADLEKLALKTLAGDQSESDDREVSDLPAADRRQFHRRAPDCTADVAVWRAGAAAGGDSGSTA